MKKQFIIVLSIITSFQLKAQIITQKDLVNISWFTDNTNTTFYKSDTILIARILNQFPEYLRLNRQYRELDYNKNNNITRLEFKKHKKVDILDVDIKSWTDTRLKVKWEWQLNTRQQLLTFYLDGKIHSKFLVKEKLNDSFIWKYTNWKNSPSEETYNLLIYKLVRLK